jgi:hypothetical protein
VAIADLLHSNAIFEGAANTPKFKNILNFANIAGPAYEPPCRGQVGRLDEDKYDYVLAGASGGATVHHSSLINL